LAAYVRITITVTEQYNLDRMDAEDEGEEEADEMEINSNMLINLPQDQRQQQLITTDFFRQAMLAATTASASTAPAAAAVSEVSRRRCTDMALFLGLHWISILWPLIL